MATLDRYQVPCVLVILVGLGIAASGFVLVPNPGQQEYHHEVQPVSESQVEDTYYSPVVEYGELSPAGQEAFRNTLENEDGHHVVYGQGNYPRDWKYPTDTAPMITYVHYEGEYHELETRGTSFEIFDWIPVGGLGLVGAVFVATGGLGSRRERPRSPPALLVGAAGLGVLVGGFRLGAVPVTGTSVVAGVAVAAAAAGATWLLFDWRWQSA